MDSTFGIRYIVIDLSPDINVVVSNTRTEYWGGSFKRGMERVNNIQTDRREDPVSFAFAEDIAGENIELKETAKITSKAAVDFEGINVNLSV